MHTMPERRFRTRSFLVTTVLVFVAIASRAGATNEQGPIEFADTLIRFEVNATDRDAGVQIFLDAEGWEAIRVVNPRGRTIFSAQGEANIQNIEGGTELFLETNEPSYAAVDDGDAMEADTDYASLQEILDLFPEGEYTFTGTTVDGRRLAGTAALTHAIPAGPTVIAPAPEAGAECAEEVPTTSAIIMWEPVERSITGDDIDITGYQVIVEQEEPLRVFSVDLSADTTTLTLPQDFLEEGVEYTFEILAKEASGNQTITQSCFATAE